MMYSSAAMNRRILEEVRRGKKPSERFQLGRLVADALVEIKRLGYSKTSRSRYRATWEHLIECSREKEPGDELSAELATRFLEEYLVKNEELDKPSHDWRRYVAFSVIDFANNGCRARGTVITV